MVKTIVNWDEDNDEEMDKKFTYLLALNVLKKIPKWDATEPIDVENLDELFGPDSRPRPAEKPRPAKKPKSVDTSGSTGGSHSNSISDVLQVDYRRKCATAESAYEAKRQKELGFLECRELEFLMIDPDMVPPHKAAFIRRKEEEIMKKYPST
ncbi:hypothetical protein OROGR_015709 [Orobanche gracilis]